MLTIDAFDHLVLNVRDVEASAAWYRDILGMRREDSRSPAGGMRTSMVFGRNKINLRPVDASQADWLTARSPGAGSADVCFLTRASPDEVADHFRRCAVRIVLGPLERRGALGPIRSVYVHDPDGNLVEVSSYVAG